MEKVDVKELKELVGFSMDLVQLGLDVAKDKKVDMSDLAVIMGKLPSLAVAGVAAFSGLKQLPVEAKDLSEAELAELIALVAAKFGAVDNAKAVLIIEKSLTVCVGVFGLIKAIVSDAPVASEVASEPVAEAPVADSTVV